MFIPITKNDCLWGLLMFYNHTGPKYASHDARMACELLAHYLSLQIAAREAAENHKSLARVTRLNAELERSNIELDSFACVASHDLKEPLRGIHRYSDFLMEDYAGKLDEAGVEKLKTLVKLSQRMQTLVDSLLHFSRVGRADLALHEVDLDGIVSETLEMIAPWLQESGAVIRRPQQLPIVRADHARVGEIFHNLLVNAIKYNDKPLKWVEIGWEEATGRRGDGGTGGVSDKATMGEEDKVISIPVSPSSSFPVAPSPSRPVAQSPIFYVRDNGIGIPERHYETIFDIFRRLHERDEFGGGVGAGLTIVKKIVERHNGRIWVESRVGVGTTVYFTLG
jgi:two-component system, chemotaxis family, sensor kinase Cph1